MTLLGRHLKSALLVVFSFWFWRLLEKWVIQKILGRFLNEIGDIDIQ